MKEIDLDGCGGAGWDSKKFAYRLVLQFLAEEKVEVPQAVAGLPGSV
jgi:hypothetical protein